MSAPEPNWYPDPSNPEQLRWWNGSVWTDGTRPAEASTTPDVPVPRNAPAGRKRGLVWGLVAGGTALALAVAGTAVWLATGNGRGSPAPSSEAQLVAGHLYLPPERLEPDLDRYLLPSSVPLSELAAKAETREDDGSEAPASSMPGIFELFTDAALTEELPVEVSASQGDISILPKEASLVGLGMGTNPAVGERLSEEHLEPRLGGESGGSWRLFERYYLVQHYDEHGEKLEHPHVHTLFKESALASPTPSFDFGERPGDVSIGWEPVEGASEYWLVKKEWDRLSGEPRHNLIDIVDGTSWDSFSTSQYSNSLIDDDDGDHSDEKQNVGLEFFGALGSYDEITYSGGDAMLGREGGQIGVVAVDEKGDTSPVRFVNAFDELRSLPSSLARQQLRATDHFPGSTTSDMSSWPSWVPVTTLDGSTRQFGIRFDPDSVTATPLATSSGWRDGLLLSYSASGTTLSDEVGLLVPDGLSSEEAVAKAKADIEAFNERALRESPRAGATVLGSSDLDAEGRTEFPDAATTMPELPFEVHGSNEFVRYLAANIADHREAVDITEYAAVPGQAETSDAVNEAVSQNPYTVGFKSYRVAAREGRQYVVPTYFFDEDEQRRAQEQLQAEAASVVAEVVDDGMDDAEKASALNDWLIDRTVYDYEALEQLELGSLPPGHPSADARGALLEGLGVCASYAEAYVLLAREAGLDAVYVSGIIEASGVNHAWNRVRIDDAWLSLDPTWNDDDNGSPRNRYLLVEEPEGYTEAATREAGSRWVAPQFAEEYATP